LDLGLAAVVIAQGDVDPIGQVDADAAVGVVVAEACDLVAGLGELVDPVGGVVAVADPPAGVVQRLEVADPVIGVDGRAAGRSLVSPRLSSS
jgi:hypothetical protein